jgi:hypothetical protein
MVAAIGSTAALASELPACRAPEIPDAASLSRLSEETGFAKDYILAMEKIACDANGDANALVPLLRSVGRDFDKAHSSPEGIEQALTGVRVMRGSSGQ